MNMKWWLIILLAGMIVLGSQQKLGQKTARYTFRCSEDKASIEMLNKEANLFTAYKQCVNGECVMESSGPMCIVTETQQPAKQSSPISSYLPIVLIVGGILYWRYRK